MYTGTVTVAVVLSFFASPGTSVAGGLGAMTSQREFPTAAGPATPTWEHPGPPALARLYCDRIIDC